MRWTFSIVRTNQGNAGIGFEQVEVGSGMGTEPFTRRLEPGAEIRMLRSHFPSCPLWPRQICIDDRGGGGRVPIAIRLNRSVGERQ
jgi:hypothetical protein